MNARDPGSFICTKLCKTQLHFNFWFRCTHIFFFIFPTAAYFKLWITRFLKPYTMGSKFVQTWFYISQQWFMSFLTFSSLQFMLTYGPQVLVPINPQVFICVCLNLHISQWPCMPFTLAFRNLALKKMNF